MKGTLYTADFINTVDGVRLLEFNTDTAFTDSLVSHIDFEPLKNVLVDNNLTTLHIIYKPGIQQNFVDGLITYMNTNASDITIETTKESDFTIYPTDVTDSSTSFILRLAYNESAVFDSEYCKENINLYKLMVGGEENFDTVINFYYSSSEDSVLSDYIQNHINYSDACPDFLVRYNGTDTSKQEIAFYKLGHSSASNEDRISDFINEMKSDNTLITNYYDTSDDTDYMKSIRVCNILYGSNLDNIQLLAKKVDAIFAKPRIDNEFIHNDANLYTKFENRHTFELATNSVKFDFQNQEGVGQDVTLESGSDTVFIENAVVGGVYKSLSIPGLPDSDDEDVFMSWSLAGNSLPLETAVTESVLVSKNKQSVVHGILNEIVIESGSFLAGPALPVLVYDSGSNEIRFKKLTNLNPNNDKLFDSDGNHVNLIENNFFILPEDGYTFSLNFEENDTFLLNETGIRIVGHNNYGSAGFYGACFIAGTKITLSSGDTKNIEDIVVGDEVVSYNEQTGFQEHKSVTKLTQPIHDDLVKYTFTNGKEIICTYDHPFYVNDMELASYKPALTNERYELPTEVSKIKENDFVFTLSGDVEVEIESIEELPRVDTQTYIFSVEDNMNFYANEILVHNKV